MASALYPAYKELLLNAGLNLVTGSTLKAQLLSSAYTYSAAHDFRDDVSAGAVGTATALATKTTTGGVFDAADTVITAVSGAAVNAILIFNDTGTPSTSRLVAYIDGVSVTPNGGDITIQWDAGANKIFAL